MNYFTINQAADRLKMSIVKLESWFYTTSNPLEEVSEIKLDRINGRRMIPEIVLEKYEEFINTYLTIKQAANFLGWEHSIMKTWVSNRLNTIRVKKVLGTNYIHKEDILPLQNLRIDLTNCMSTREIMNELKIDRSTVLDAIHNNHIVGWFQTLGGHHYVPREAFEEYKQKYFKIENINDYYSIGEAANILECSTSSIHTMIRNPKIELTGVKYKFKNTYYLLKRDVHTFKNFIDEIPLYYYTVNQIADKYNVSRRFVDVLMANQLSDKVKWLVLNRQAERVILIKEFVAFYASFDKYRVDKPEDPHFIFNDAILSISAPAHLLQTKALFLEYVSLRQNTSRASKQVQRMQAREFVFLYQALMNFEEEITNLSDHEIKWYLRTTTSTNLKKNFISFLSFLQERIPTQFQEKYLVTTRQTGTRSKEIYSLEEFIEINHYLKNVEFHILEAINDRCYAAAWLYCSLHMCNAWRSSDFLRLPSVDISLIDIHAFQWFFDGNRLSIEQSQRIINQYAHARLNVSKTGVLNRFLINLDMLVPIATMVVVCELHRRKENAQFLLTRGNTIYSLIRTKVDVFLPDPLRFGSMKMNRSFMTYLFHEATENTESLGVALDMIKQTRRHRKKESSTVYIQSTNKDGSLGNVTVNLCNRGHFGYLYNMLIERAHALTELENKDTVTKRSLKIQEYRTLFTTPLELENFGEFLKNQVEEKESLAIRVSLLPREAALTLVNNIYMDKMPGHTEHTQCFVYPKCIHPTATSCIGCPNVIPKNYLLISIDIELRKRISILSMAKNSGVASRERAWIYKILSLLQETTNTYGIEYTRAFVDYENLLSNVAAALQNQQSLVEHG
ncbi:helix-turn-helix domain-containing protein [Paenibacillus sp. HWE-109]|uniref:helix-turn-helix domain-containing protein n=1 Tax=Paenibacillus sp. HWE-109 TaxID=1306526 RepID=UPI001EE08AD0|nr:helix-turn-helix domain-containing protein [Paenibacillus sp. HWE-109]UKS29979.1 helix-turn-helix domain-containing protein [Paenibacillus sp. HWE-109]